MGLKDLVRKSRAKRRGVDAAVDSKLTSESTNHSKFGSLNSAQVDSIITHQADGELPPVLWLEQQVESSWSHRTPKIIEIPLGCPIPAEVIAKRVCQRLEQYWLARPHEGVLMSARLLPEKQNHLQLFRVPQDTACRGP